MTIEHFLPEKIDTLQDLICWSLGQLARPFDPAGLIRAILCGLRNSTGSIRADLLMYQADMNVLFFAETSVQEAEKGGPTQLSLADTKNSAPIEALGGAHTVLVCDVRESIFPSFSAGARTLLAVPVIYGERMHGVLNMEHSLPDAYDEESVKLIEAISSILAVLLEQSYLSEQVFRLNQKLIDQMTETASEGDPQYRAHAERVGEIAGAIAKEMGLDPSLIRAVVDSGYLHDIGKSGISKSILVKPGKLSEDEMHEVRRHPILGRFLLKPLGFQPEIIEAVASHHERWDGTGYPRGLSGKQIPIAGRILAVAEAYDVMTSDQPYRPKMTKEEALKEIKSQMGKQFDPEVVEALLRLKEI